LVTYIADNDSAARRRFARVRLGVVGLACAFALIVGFTARRAGASQSTDDAQALAVVQRLFDGMRTRDTALLRAIFDSSARLISTRQGEMRTQSADGFIRAIATAKPGVVLNERMWAPEVRIDADLAQVWAKYDFHNSETFSHCGVDAFELTRTSSGWKIVQVAYTVRTTGCTPAPAR
jgi:hypothetical protein